MTSPRAHRAAGADWAFIKDASALAIIETLEPASSILPLPLLRVVHLREIRNPQGAPRDPRDVAQAFADDLEFWGVATLASDAHYRASWQPVLANRDIEWKAAPVKESEIAESFLALRIQLHAERLILPRSARLKSQLADVTARATTAGLRVDAKRRRDADGGTSHGDLVSALVLALWQLSHGAQEYTHAGVPSRSAGIDPRHSKGGADIGASFAGIPRGQYAEYASERDED